jgi:hypothetical protein
LSNYIVTTDFAAKDALPSGNPAKLAQGTQLDTELDNIATAIATKEDVANKGSANGYAGLDSGAKVAKSNLPTAVAYEDESNVFTGTQRINDTSRWLLLSETDASANEGLWRLGANSGQLLFGSRTDADNAGVEFMTVDRTNATIDSVALAATTVTVNGQDVRNTAILNSGTLADARVAQSNVTQHQAALSIAETQIPDGAVLARVGGNETISGTWSFTATPTITNASPQIRLTETGVTANNTVWGLRVDGEQFVARVENDALNTATNFITVDRTANTVDTLELTATTVTVNGQNVRDAAILSSGTLPVARGGTGTTTSTGTGSTVLSASPTFTGTVTAATLNATTLQQGGVGVSLTGHTHSAADITSGTLAIARGGTGQTDGTARNITGKAGVTKTLSTSVASGGSDGDIWYRY